jgi:hypothetical protein
MSRGNVDSSSKTEISLEMPPNISDRHTMSLSVETTDTPNIFNEIQTTQVRQEHLVHVHVLVRRVRQPILKKILRLELLPVCGIQNCHKVRGQAFNLGPSHLAQFCRWSKKHEPRHKVMMEQLRQLVAISSRRLFYTPVLIAQLLKSDFPSQPSEKHDHSLLQIQLPKAIVALTPLRSVGFNEL